ncbi:hypothetical protein [Candidatus Nitrosocosmicus sp. T]
MNISILKRFYLKNSCTNDIACEIVEFHRHEPLIGTELAYHTELNSTGAVKRIYEHPV